MGEVLLTIVNCHTVTKPYAGFRHPDQMASDQTVRGGEHFVPPQWHFSFLHAGRHFPNFLEIYPVVKRKKRVWSGRIELLSLGILILSFTHRSWLTYMRAQTMKYQAILYDISDMEECKIPAWPGRGTNCSGTNRGLFYSQKCSFLEESFIFISLCCSAVRSHSGNMTHPTPKIEYLWAPLQTLATLTLLWRHFGGQLGGGGGGVKVTRNIQMWIWKAQLEERILH